MAVALDAGDDTVCAIDRSCNNVCGLDGVMTGQRGPVETQE